MIELVGDLWDLHTRGAWICITTNGVVNGKGRLIMGAGIAKEARDRFPGLDRMWGDITLRSGQQVIFQYPSKIICFPTKEHWRAPSPLWLIEKSARELAKIAWDRLSDVLPSERIYLPRPGCGLGGLQWEKVKPVLESILTDERFVVVTPK